MALLPRFAMARVMSEPGHQQILLKATRRRAAQRMHNYRSASTSSSSQQLPPPRTSGRVLTLAAVGALGIGSYFLGSLYPPSFIELAFATPAPPPSLPGSPEAEAAIARLEKQLQSLPQVKALQAQSSPPVEDAPRRALTTSTGKKESPTTAVNKEELPGPAEIHNKRHFVLSRPYADFPAHMLVHSLTSGSLRKPGMLAVPPLVMSKTKHGASKLGGHQGDAFAFLHLGRSLCGHDGIIHGGLLATVMDETLARTSFFNLPHNVGVTAHLEIDYRKPVKADQFVVVETKLVEAKGRKVAVEGVMRSLQGETLIESRAIFVEPRMIQWLDTSIVRKVMDTSDE